MSVRGYLQQLKLKVDAKSLASPLRVVTGNQSADMDSCISAIAYSYYNNIHDQSFIVPLINIPRADFKLRRDIINLLESHSISEDLLYFTDDLPSLNSSGEKLEVSLVDHCNIQGNEFQALYDADKLKIVSIIDHHADENVFKDANPRIITPSGSCSSLIFNYWKDILNVNAEKTDIISILLGALLIDTSNFTKKIENDDTIAFNAYKAVLSKFSTASTELTFDDFYNQLKDAKKDMTDFTFNDILRKDYKQFRFSTGVEVGFSSIGKSLYWIVKNYKKEIDSTLSNFLTSNNLDLIIITSSYSQKETKQYTREFCYYYQKDPNEKFLKLHDNIQQPLRLSEDIYNFDKLKLKDLKFETGIFKIYNQRNVDASRKQVVPIVKDILESN